MIGIDVDDSISFLYKTLPVRNSLIKIKAPHNPMKNTTAAIYIRLLFGLTG
jgi:hypothetical protein